MIKVYQTRYGKEKGNCYQACLASVLELPLEDVPDFCNLYKEPFGAWQIEANKWLRQFGLATITCSNDFSDSDMKERFRDCYLIVTGKNSNGINHCVVWQNGKTVHNPNKNCKGIKPETIDLIFPLDLGEYMHWESICKG
jgi:hypothetical protein